MSRAYTGAAMVVIGAAAWIVAYANHHAAYTNLERGLYGTGSVRVHHPASGLSQVAFDAV